MLSPDELHPILQFLQLALATLGVAGIGWIIKRAISVENEILQAKYEMKAEINRGFTQTDARIGKLESDLFGHERLDDERFKTAEIQRDRISTAVANLTGRKSPTSR